MFNEEENKYISELYYLSERTPRIAAELFRKKFGYTISKDTIRYKWEQIGFELRKRGGLQNGLSKEQFIDLYKKSNGDIESILKNASFRYKPESIKTLIHKYGLISKI